MGFCIMQHMVMIRHRVNGVLYAVAASYIQVVQTCSGLETLHHHTPAAAFKATQLLSEARPNPRDSCTLGAQQEQQ